MPPGRVAVAGSTTVDRNRVGGRERRQTGGVTAYAGLTYRRHGLETVAVTNVAPADAAVLRPLSAAGIEVRNGPAGSTTCFANTVAGGRRRQRMPAAAPPVRAAQLAEVADAVDLLHLGPLHPLDLDPAALAPLGRTRAAVALDLQGYVRAVDGGVVRPAVSGYLAEALAAARLVKAAEAELALVLRAWRITPAALVARFGLDELVVTAGGRDGRVWTAAGAEVPFAAVPVAAVADPTGAGDVFFAAYLARRLFLGQEVAAACAGAAEVAARQVAGKYIPAAELALFAA